MRVEPSRIAVAPSSIGRFLRFAGLSGLGWLLDVLLLLTLVHSTSLSPAVANVVSSCTAALSVFLVSRLLVFDTASHYLLIRVVIYVFYVLVVIFVASFAIAALVQWLAPLFAQRMPPSWVGLAAAGVAKVIVTPPQLLFNFLVARHLSERAATLRMRDA